MPASLFFCIRNHNRFVVLGILVRPPIVPCSTMRVRATQQGALRKIRTLDNHRWAQPIQDVRCARRRVSVAEVECKSGSHPSPSEERLFSSPELRWRLKRRHFAYEGFSSATSGLIRDLSFEGANYFAMPTIF